MIKPRAKAVCHDLDRQLRAAVFAREVLRDQTSAVSLYLGVDDTQKLQAIRPEAAPPVEETRRAG